MSLAARLAASGRTHGRLISILGAVAVFGTLALVPARGGAAGDTWPGSLAADSAAGPQAAAVTSTGQSFGGLAAVGALFGESSGKLGSHFCTASVVDSPHGDLAITAAHCVTGTSGQIAFVPGYANGTEPYGVWQVTQVYTDAAWRSAQDPDDDVAFLRLSGAPGGASVEAVTGAEHVATGAAAGGLVRVVGYPDTADQPVSCVNAAKLFSPTQLEFDCGGYTDGTSGGPFLADVSAATGQGTVIGVIGGYEQGGDTPQVSYSVAFGAAVTVLYQAAKAAS
jgi:V8-like Glu-specific endopeptidase